MDIKQSIERIIKNLKIEYFLDNTIRYNSNTIPLDSTIAKIKDDNNNKYDIQCYSKETVFPNTSYTCYFIVQKYDEYLREDIFVYRFDVIGNEINKKQLQNQLDKEKQNMIDKLNDSEKFDLTESNKRKKKKDDFGLSWYQFGPFGKGIKTNAGNVPKGIEAFNNNDPYSLSSSSGNNSSNNSSSSESTSDVGSADVGSIGESVMRIKYRK